MNTTIINPWLRSLIDLIYPISPHERIISRYSFEQFKKSCVFSDYSARSCSAIIRYQDPLGRALIHSVKFSKNSHAARICAGLLAEKINALTNIHEQIVVIPMPSSKERLREKGFNQCFEIAKYLGPLLDPGISIRTDILRKRVNTSRQTLSSRTDRLHNLIDCFTVTCPESLTRESLARTHFIIFDDVLTTGATLQTALKTLSAASLNVIAIAVAH